MELTISEERHNEGVMVLNIVGRLNAVTAGELKERVKSLIEESFIHIIFVLTETSFIDSSGLSAIVSTLKRVREKNGSLKLVGVSSNVRKVFELTHLERIFEFYEDVEQALK